MFVQYWWDFGREVILCNLSRFYTECFSLQVKLTHCHPSQTWLHFSCHTPLQSVTSDPLQVSPLKPKIVVTFFLLPDGSDCKDSRWFGVVVDRAVTYCRWSISKWCIHGHQRQSPNPTTPQNHPNRHIYPQINPFAVIKIFHPYFNLIY